MATIKNYTDLEQSKKLSEILPLETSDGFWEYHNKWYSEGDEWEGYEYYPRAEPYLEYTRKEDEWREDKSDVPCWSLTALLGVLPPYLYEWEKGIDFNLYPSVSKERWWCAGYISQDLSIENKNKFKLIIHGSNPIDACVDMILELHKLNLL